MRIASVGRALPPHRYQQAAIRAALAEIWREQPGVVARLDALADALQVQQRYLALPLERYAGLNGFGQTNDAWLAAALDLGERAVGDALALAGLQPRDVDAMFSVSVTGIASPSLEARLANRMRLRADLKRVPMFGLGCVAGAAGIARAADYVRAFPAQVAVLLAVELCSLTLQRDDTSAAHLISTLLFGDGAAAVVLVGAERSARIGCRGPIVRATRSTLYPDTEDAMGWRISARGFEIVLSPAVPVLAREQLPRDVDAFLGEQGLSRSRIASWVCHPGGPKVLRALQDGLELPDAAVALARRVLAEQGNLSSASVLMVLREVFDRARPAPGDLGLIVAMGPGFCSELVLVEW